MALPESEVVQYIVPTAYRLVHKRLPAFLRLDNKQPPYHRLAQEGRPRKLADRRQLQRDIVVHIPILVFDVYNHGRISWEQPLPLLEMIFDQFRAITRKYIIDRFA